MPLSKNFKKNSGLTLTDTAQAALLLIAKMPRQIPLGALLVASSMGAMAQQTTADEDKTLKTVVIKERAEAPEGKDALRATITGIGKGTQELRDIPQSITVVTEKLMDDRNLDTLKDVLHNTSGVTFLAAEGGEEDIRLRGFSLATTGDIFVDGIRDPAFYDRDTFNNDRVELLRGSASMLFGRGSTGGAVNQVSKVPRLMDEHQIDMTVGSYNYRRVVGDFNFKTGDSAALRLNLMNTTADNNGSGSSIDKSGVAATYRWGIGERDEFSVGLYSLENKNGMNYGMPWILPTTTSAASETTMLPIDPNSYYGMASDYNKGRANHLSLSHLHRFDDGGELKTQVRKGAYERDQRASTIRFGNAASQPGGTAASLATFGPNTALTRGAQLKIQDMNNLNAQSDYSNKFEALGLRHEVITGFDLAQENRSVYGARTAAQGGVVPTKPNTTVGAPDDGASVNEASRVLRKTNQYDSAGWGVYLQDLVQVAPHWKLLGGLRYDNMVGNYDLISIPTNAPGPETVASYQMTVAGWSPRIGALFQPNDLHSYHFSAGTSFNTSGETYSLSSSNTDTPPEKSYNVEFGAKLDSADKRYTTRLGIFHSVKFNERNTDPLQPGVTVLSGRRHVSGFEIDLTGRLTPQLEIYGSYMWMPDALIDVGGQGAEAAGARPSLTPVHSGTVWSTYQFTSQVRAGAGVNFRSEQTPNRNPGWSAPAYATLDVMAEYKINERYTLKGNVANVTNTLYADAIYTGHYIPGSGRNVQVNLSVKF